MTTEAVSSSTYLVNDNYNDTEEEEEGREETRDEREQQEGGAVEGRGGVVEEGGEMGVEGGDVRVMGGVEGKVVREMDGGGSEGEVVGRGVESSSDDVDKRERDGGTKSSDINLATPTRAEVPSLEFFDHNLTSSDSSDLRVRSVKVEDEEEGEGEGEVVRSKVTWDQQKESAKLLDLESPVDARRAVSKEEEDTRDLKATITHREKEGTRADSYINYRIVTETTRASHLYEEAHYEVWRRYRDFEWLRLQIERSYPTLIIPPLPGKQVARYFNHMGETFLEERQRALGKFLWRLTVHPYFSSSTDLKAFLTATPEDFAGYVQESQGRQKLLDKLSTSMRQAHTALMLKDPEFAKESKYFSELGEKMSLLDRIAARLHGERETLQLACDDFSVSLFHWAANEQVMTQPLQKLASCVEKCSHLIKQLNDANTYTVIVAVKEYQLYVSSAVGAIRRRDALQLEEERSGLDRDRKRRHHDEATSSGKVQRVVKLADDLEKVGLVAEKAQDELSQANEQLRVDVEKWHEAKNKEVCQFMRQFANNHMEYHQKCFSEWESALKRLRAVSASLSPDSVQLATMATSSSQDSEDTSSDS